MRFVYATSYLARSNRISLYRPELPLRTGYLEPIDGLTIPGCLRDGCPDSWGRRVIEHKLRVAENSLSEAEYMLASGTNRFGANDFQESSSTYVPREDGATLDELHEAARLLDEGKPLSPSMEAALVDGTTIGGARPKVLVTDESGVQWIAKLSASSDRVFSVINAEATATELARRAGIDTSETQLTTSLGRDVLLVRRFDRGPNGARHHAVSALTMAAENEYAARYVTYPDIVRVLKDHSRDAASVGPAIFERIAFNIAIGNSDDHARNHAALWDGETLTLSPAFDLTPNNRTGRTAAQAMSFDSDGTVRQSSLAALLSCAHEYDLTVPQARQTIDRLVESIRDNWREAVDIGRLTEVDEEHLTGRQFLNPGIFDDYSPSIPTLPRSN